MRRLRLFISSLIAALLLSSPVLAYEDLTELEARTSRKSTNTFYSGEDASTYVWQPQTVIYKDTSTNHEIWVWSQLDDEGTNGRAGQWYGPEYGWQPWSADGKRMAFTQDKNVGCYTRDSENYSPWFTANSDGTYWRPVCESSSRTDNARRYFNWSPTLPDVAYAVGWSGDGNRGKDRNAVYREVIGDTSCTSTLIVDMIPENTSTNTEGQLKDNLTSDGLYFIGAMPVESEPFYIVQVEPSGSRELKLSWNLPTLNTYWFTTTNPSSLHDEFVTGNASEGYWFYVMPGGSSVWWRIHLWGTDDGAPNHTVDNYSPYTWWEGTAAQQEVQVTHDERSSQIGNYPAFVTSDRNMAHTSVGRWGTHVAYANNNYPRAETLDVRDSDNNWTVKGSYSTSANVQYHSWNGFTDYPMAVTTNTSEMIVYKYNARNIGEVVGQFHSSVTSGFSKPGQSPDGTKAVVRSDWLNPTNQTGDVFVAVAYFPYPPEITSVSATGGTVTVTFEWMLDSTPRGYATRGWPNESTDDPPPPRETEKFRLWRSIDKSTWIPVTTINANIFGRYDFSDGTWKGNCYWEITDNPGDGTFYYAVTALEHSGLESHTLNNIFSIMVSGGAGTGSQNTAYPANPGGDSKFYTTAPDEPIVVTFTYKESPATADGQYTIKWTRPANYTMIRYYNIYAEDGSTPTIAQQNRIASIPASAAPDGSFSWVDWLGNPDGTTQYVVTGVDYLGNESGTPSTVVLEDDEEPTVPDGLSATAISSSQINPSWDFSTDNVGVAGYKIYRDGSYIDFSTTTSYSDTGLTPSTTYTYKVSAYDAKGNESAQSSTTSATTQGEGSSDTTTVIDVGNTWKYFKGQSDPGSEWNNVSFNDSSWLEGPTGIGFGDDDDATVLSDMQNNYLTVYARRAFEIADPTAITEMILNIDYDDGFVAYINGEEVARSNMSGTTDFDTPASGWNEAGTPETFDLSASLNVLRSGTNVLAIETHNATINSSDVSFIPQLILTMLQGTEPTPIPKVPSAPAGLTVIGE